jgi:ATP-dependent 26S proteasome regulatory subunit
MRVRTLFTILILLVVTRGFAQSESRAPQAPPVQITGVVQSFTTGKYLIVKPANTAAISVDVPAKVQVDRSQLKEGVRVVVEANRIETGYLAIAVTIQK